MYDSPQIEALVCRALYDYKSEEEGRLSILKDDEILILQMVENGWWDGICKNNRGWFPSNYCTEPQQKFIPFSKDFGWEERFISETFWIAKPEDEPIQDVNPFLEPTSLDSHIDNLSLDDQPSNESQEVKSLLNSELTTDTDLNQLTEQIYMSIDKIKSIASESLDGFLQQEITPVLINETKACVTLVGNFLAIVEDVHYSNDSLNLEKFSADKKQVYDNITDLVNATTQMVNSFIQSDSCELILDISVVLENSIQNLLDSFDVVSQEKNENPPSIKRKESHLCLRPRRAISLNVLNQKDEEQSQRKSSSSELKRAVMMKRSKENVPQNRRITVIGTDSNKLNKFFGEHVALEKFPYRSATSKNLIRYDYNPKNLLLSSEGLVKGATLPVLIEHITLHDKFDAGFTQAFLLTYRTYCSSLEVFELLKQRFFLKPPIENLSDKEYTFWKEQKLVPVQLRTVNVFKTWIDHYFLDQNDFLILNPLSEFIKNDLKRELPIAAEQLLKLIEKKRNQVEKPNRPPLKVSNNFPTPILPKNFQKMNLMDLDSLELARQLTLIDSKLYAKIEITEFLNKSWTEKENPSSGPSIKKMIHTSNRLTSWVAETILMESDIKKRCSFVKHFIMIAEKCRHLNNFNTLMSILAALNSSSIHRLKRTFENLPSKYKNLLDELKQTMAPSQNFSNYRNQLNSSQRPCVPFLGLFLTDVVFIEDGNSDFVKSFPHLINFDKRMKLADKIKEIEQYKQVSYSLIEVKEIKQFLIQQMDSSNIDQEELYQKSLLIEPREREDEKIARLLQESGFL